MIARAFGTRRPNDSHRARLRVEIGRLRALAALLALLADGAAWSTSALALAFGASQRTVQRALLELAAAGRVRSIGRARAQRWLSPPLAGFTTILLLPAALPPG